MKNEKRKMAFYEIQKGKLALDFQKAFEEAQTQAFIHNSPSSITLKIAVFPPPDRTGRFGQVQYAVSKSLPSVKSMKLTTQLTNEGLITEDGASQIDILQEELEFEETVEPQIVNFNKEK